MIRFVFPIIFLFFSCYFNLERSVIQKYNLFALWRQASIGNSNSSGTNNTATYQVGGTVSGLPSSGVTLVVANASDVLNITTNGSFIFPTKYVNGTSYNVIIQSQPSGYSCIASNSSGNINLANVNVPITCAATNVYYTISINISGISSSATFTNNSSDSLTLSSSGTYNFPTQVPAGSNYSVNISSQSSGQICAFTDSKTSGTASANVTLNVSCSSGYLNSGSKFTSAVSDISPFTELGFTTIVAGSIGGTSGSANGSGTGAFFNSPLAVASDGTNVYISEFGGGAGLGRIRKYDPKTTAVTTLAGGNTGGGVSCSGTALNCKDGN